MHPIAKFLKTREATNFFEFSTQDRYTNFLHCPNFSEFSGVIEILTKPRLLQIVLFLTDSIFLALCAYFDESMDCIGGISHGKVRIQ